MIFPAWQAGAKQWRPTTLHRLPALAGKKRVSLPPLQTDCMRCLSFVHSSAGNKMQQNIHRKREPLIEARQPGSIMLALRPAPPNTGMLAAAGRSSPTVASLPVPSRACLPSRWPTHHPAGS